MADHEADGRGFGEPQMLEKIDKLFACGVGELIDLPQIVVVGDQSSGKSSVLEGLIKKPLPRDSGLCTRFATQIVFRRSSEEHISVSIIPDRDSLQEHSHRASAWRKILPFLDSKTFVELMQEVHQVMGLSGDCDNTQRKPTFSRDVLRLEISGPDQEHLSVIDVPGIFKSTTEGLTTKSDILLVRNMVKAYMENPRSVMLTVIPSNVDIATQEILELAAEADPRGDRTLGVLTKPDLVDKGAEPPVMDLIEGRSRQMKLSWHMIRNPGQKELSDTDLDRGALERDFFRSHLPWSGINKDRVGIRSLRLRLQEVLCSLVKAEFSKVKTEIKNRLDISQKHLNDLGPERKGSAEQTAYLINLATKFQRLVSLALSADYGADDLFNNISALRVAPAIMSRMKAFSDDMSNYGQTYSFTLHIVDDGKETSQLAPEKRSFHTRKEEDLEELLDILHPQESLSFPRSDGMSDWLREVFRENRGFELGTFNPSILATTMKRQSSKWMGISMGYISDAIVIIHRFIAAAVASVCGDYDVQKALLDTLSEDLIKRYNNAIDSIEFLLNVENGCTPMTLNHYFNENLQKSRQEKILTNLKQNAFHNGSHGMVIKLEQAGRAYAMSNDEHVIEEIHDVLKSYYKVSRKTFVDNVCKQATNHFLLHSGNGPLRLFSPTFVNRLSNVELEEIAGEAPPLKRIRVQLKREVVSLREAMKILARA